MLVAHMVRLECVIDLFKQFGEPNVHGAFRTRDRSIQIVRGSKCALEEFDDLTDRYKFGDLRRILLLFSI